jgi:hypothetical protein
VCGPRMGLDMTLTFAMVSCYMICTLLLCYRTFTIRDAMLSDVYVVLWYVLSQYLKGAQA